ncbi:MAG: cardiolipin synthase [Gemella sp.]|nr:cardiolipin synthase [Gemella sp.]
MYNHLFVINLSSITSIITSFINTPTLIAAFSLLHIAIIFATVFIEKKKASSSWAWLLVLIILPYLGVILYLLLGRSIHRDKIYPYSKDKKIEFQKKLLQRDEPYIINDSNVVVKKNQNLIKLNYQSNQAFLSTNNEIEILTEGKDKFDNLFEDIRNASSYIHVQYYIIKKDHLGNQLIDLLIEKLNQGVDVYLLYDDIGSRTLNSFTLRKLIKAGAKTKSFFKSQLPLINLRMNYRNHRKLVVIDGEIAYTGGFNVGNEYIGLDKKMGNWRDTHLRIKGEAVSLLNLRFIDDWNSQASKKSDHIKINDYLINKTTTSSSLPIQIVTSGPDEEIDQIKYAYINMINNAKKYIYIQSPYFILDESMMDALRMAILSGVDVKIMIPDRSDHPLIRWGNYSNVGKLIEDGATVYEYTRGFLHAKTMIIDDEVASVGTANFDNRSFKLNFEINTFIYDIEETKKFRKIFMEDTRHSTILSLEKYNNRSRLIKMKESLAELISPIL